MMHLVMELETGLMGEKDTASGVEKGAEVCLRACVCSA